MSALVVVRFLGGSIRLPAGPWIVAGMLGIPVVLGFGIYRGGRSYECQLELFERRIELPRERREESLHECAQRYATRLEEHVRASPFNWFNFHDYWIGEGSVRDATAAH